MMNLKYYKWLDLKVTHNYFPDGVGPALRMVPLVDTIRSMGNYEILIHNKNNLFSFYTGVRFEGSFDIALEFSELENLYFQIVLDDHLFFSYTEIPALIGQQVFYFINSESSSNVQKTGSVSGNDILDVKPESFTITLPEGEATVAIKNTTGEVFSSYNFAETNSGFINMDDKNSRTYEIWVNDEHIESFFYTNTPLEQNTIGIFQLDVKLWMKQNMKNFILTLNFEALSVYWQYQIIVPDTRKVKVISMEITGANNEDYIGPVLTEIVGGQTAKVFTSNGP